MNCAPSLRSRFNSWAAEAVRRATCIPPKRKARHMTDDPFTLFDAWYAEARETEINDSNAMALATVDAAGQPSVRMVLLKGHDPRGFVFYTNRESRKAGDLAENARAALLFHWKSLRRQIRIEGAVTWASDAESDAYFATRSRDSQLGAWASDQSRPRHVAAALGRLPDRSRADRVL